MSSGSHTAGRPPAVDAEERARIARARAIAFVIESFQKKEGGLATSRPGSGTRSKRNSADASLPRDM